MSGNTKRDAQDPTEILSKKHQPTELLATIAEFPGFRSGFRGNRQFAFGGLDAGIESGRL